MQEQNPNQLQNENIETVQEPVVNSNPVVEPVVPNEGGIPEVGTSVSAPTPTPAPVVPETPQVSEPTPVVPVEQPSQATLVTPMETPVEQPTTISTSSSKKSPVGIIVILAVVVIAIVALYFLFIKKDNNTNQQEQIPSTPAVVDKTDKNDNKDLFMIVDSNLYISSESALLIGGHVRSGNVKVGDTLELLGMGKETKEVVVKKIKVNNKEVEEATANDLVAITIGNNLTKEDGEIGMILAAPDTIKLYEEIEVEYTSHRDKHIFDQYRPLIKVYDIKYNSIFNISNPNGIAPGETAKIKIQLEKPAYFEVGKEYDVVVGLDNEDVGKIKVTKLIK